MKQSLLNRLARVEAKLAPKRLASNVVVYPVGDMAALFERCAATDAKKLLVIAEARDEEHWQEIATRQQSALLKANATRS